MHVVNTPKKPKKRWSLRKKIIVWVLFSVLIVGVLAIVYVASRGIAATNRVFKGTIFSLIAGGSSLKKDAKNRTNILAFGTSQDDIGHSGSLLADSIMVISLDQETKEGSFISVPRDLWVTYDSPNCSVGSQGKVNAVFLCGLQANNNNETAASEFFAKKISDVLGIDIQYSARVDYGAIRDSVNALGGIDVVINSRDPRGIFDLSSGLYWPNGPQVLSGDSALSLARARGSIGGYGLERSNFDREKNQQLIVKAIQKKALNAGTLANPFTASAFLDSLGDNVHTTIASEEVKSLIDVLRAMNEASWSTIDIGDTKLGILTTGSYSGQSIVRPAKGILDYSALQGYVQSSLK